MAAPTPLTVFGREATAASPSRPTDDAASAAARTSPSTPTARPPLAPAAQPATELAAHSDSATAATVVAVAVGNEPAGIRRGRCSSSAARLRPASHPRLGLGRWAVAPTAPCSPSPCSGSTLAAALALQGVDYLIY